MISDLPQDLIEEILSRVPVTSLRRLRSTCKRWYHQALFKDTRFIKKYLDKTARQYHALMVINYKVCSMSSVVYNCMREIDMSLGGHRLNVPDSDAPVDLSQAFHCDGIFLCTLIKLNMIVAWNPFSGQTRWIQLQKHYKGAYALGYDNNELFRSYKILRFPCRYGNMAVWNKLNATPKLEMYDFSSNSWRNLDVIAPDQAYIKRYAVSLKGNTYWVSSNQKGDSDYSLLSFDFSTERFHRLCAPFHHDACQLDTMALSVFKQDHLSLLYQSKKTGEVEIWMTDEIETTFVSWSKFLTVDLNNHCFSNPVSFFIIDKEKKIAACCGDHDYHGNFNMLWIVREEEEYRLLPDKSVHGTELWCLHYFTHVPRLFGYVPKLAL